LVNFYSWVSVNPLSNNLSLKFTKKKKFKSFLSFEYWSLWVRHSTLQVVSHFFSEYVREHVNMQLLPQDEFHAWLQAYPLLMFLEKMRDLFYHSLIHWKQSIYNCPYASTAIHIELKQSSKSHLLLAFVMCVKLNPREILNYHLYCCLGSIQFFVYIFISQAI